MKRTTVILFIVVLVSGCATKHYGRQQPLTSAQQVKLSCQDIDIKTAKIDTYLDEVEKESNFDGRSVLSFMVDLGIGNTLEKHSAIEAAQSRRAQLLAASAARGCALPIAK
ncbi:hypothetical protein HBO11_03950 [Pseudomonas sp. WS 5010]|uniref:hypothetical protein n=1 Tax=Pseudomonas sp. WS 5010 TaxID=2717489 RepID=UPI00147542F4|nr:hypothetical protein [Pseudomonas sp. WS 5010]NMX84707.1 hypothetical protein [Pseudomonas sp. WS 5010]